MEAVLGTDRANEIISYCYGVRAQWGYLGVRLGVLHSTLEAIEAGHRGDVDRCLSTLISTWLRRAKGDVKEDVRPTWKSLCEALSYINGPLAETIAREHGCDYINPIVSEVADSPDADPPVFLPQSCGCGQCTVKGWAALGPRVCQNVYNDKRPLLLVVDPRNQHVADLVRFQSSYDRQMALCTETNQIIALYQIVYSITWEYFENFDGKKVEKIASKLSKWLTRPFSMESNTPQELQKFMHSLNLSLFNFESLEFLARKFLCSHSAVMDSWDMYIKRFSKYCEQRSLTEYKNVFFKTKDQRVFLLEVDDCFSKFTLSDIRDLRKTLSTVLKIPLVSLHLVTVKTGSLFIYFHYGYTDYLIVFQSLSAQQLREIASIKCYRILSLVDFYDQFKHKNIQEYRCLEEAVPKSDINKEDLSSSEEIKLTNEQFKKKLDENRTELEQCRVALEMYKKLSLKKDMQLSKKGTADNVTLPPLPPPHSIPASPEGSATIEESSKNLKQSREKAIGEALAEARGGELFQCNLVFHGLPTSGKSSTKFHRKK